jgi:Protein of unknown function (DUF2950)
MTIRTTGRTDFRLIDVAARFGFPLAVACAALWLPATLAAAPAAEAVVGQTVFKTPEAAVEALVAAAEKFDVTALKEILGPDGVDLVVTDDPVLDKNQAAAFAAQARVKSAIVRDPRQPGRAVMTLGAEDWPAPIPLVKGSGGWRFDTKAGREEVLFRRIGQNELSAIQICRGLAEAQHEYASEKRDGATVNQYAQRIVSTPGRQDGLAWQAPGGSWQGPVGEGIARVIAEGYTERYEPYHGYYFKILKGQGPAAPLGEMDFVVKGVMIGGFAMVAAPAEYGVTGVKTFIVGSSGIVYEQDLGPPTLAKFYAMDRYNPDAKWKPVKEP